MLPGWTQIGPCLYQCDAEPGTQVTVTARVGGPDAPPGGLCYGRDYVYQRVRGGPWERAAGD